MSSTSKLFLRRFICSILSLYTSIGMSAALARAGAQELSASPGGDRVDVFIDGSWEAGAALQLGLRRVREDESGDGWRGEQVLFPGFSPSAFRNIVDLTLSVRLDDRYYFETVFVDDFDLDSLLFGYDGRESDTVERVRIGLGPIAIDDYPGMESGSAGSSVFGADISLAGQRSASEGMIRFEQSQPDILRIQGGTELAEARIASERYRRGIRFVLPDRPVSGLRVFVETGSTGTRAADGRRYRELDLNRDAVVSLSQGTISLNQPARGRVLATYETASGDHPGDPGTGEAFVVPIASDGFLEAAGLENQAGRFDATRDQLGYASSSNGSVPSETAGAEFLQRIGRASGNATQDALFVEIDGVPAVLLYEPGYFSPFERLDSYLLSRPGSPSSFPDLRFVRRDGNAELPLQTVPPARFSADGDLLLLGRGDPDDVSSRYPFTTIAGLYGPAASRVLRADTIPFDLLLTVADAVDRIRLPSGAIPGTVTMTRNGIPDSRFELQPDGTVLLGSPALPQDILEFRFRTAETEGASGTLRAASGTRIQLSERNRATASLQYTRDIGTEAFTTRSTQAIAETRGTVSVRHEGEYLQAGLLARTTLTNPDTTGLRRLFDLDATRTPVPVTPWRVLPGAVPGPVVEPAGFPDNLDAGTRGRLFFRDYQSDNGFLPADTPLEAEREYPFEDGSYTGPYLASLPGTSGTDPADRAMVIDYELQNGHEWVSAQLQFGPDTAAVTPAGLRFTISTIGLSGDVDVYMQLGATGEDLDGDGIADAGRSSAAPAFPFAQTDAITLLAGGKATPDARGQAAREDGLLRGFLASEDPNRIVTRELFTNLGNGTVSASGTDIVVELTAEERARIDTPRALRFVVVPSGNHPATGRILVSSVELLARPVFVRSSGSGTATTVPESSVTRSDGSPLPETRFLARVHPESQAFTQDPSPGDGNRVLSVRGNETESTDIVSVHDPVRLSDYGTLVFYLHTGTATGPVLVSVESGSDGTAAIAASFSVDRDPDWQRIEVDTRRGRVRRGEEDIGTATINPAVELRRTIISLSSDENPWTVYLDEPHLSGSRHRIDGSIVADLNYRGPTDWFTMPGGVRVGDLAVDVSGQIDASRAQVDGEGVQADTVRLDAASAISLGNMRVGISADWVYAPVFEEQSLILGHRVATVEPWHGLEIGETYTRSMTTVGRTVENHDVEASLSRPPWRSDLRARRVQTGSIREQLQRLSLSLAPVQAQVRLTQTGIADDLRVATPYAATWVASYPALLPSSMDETTRRTGSAAATLSHEFSRATPSLSLDTAWTSIPASAQLNADSTAQLAVELEPFGDTGIRLTPFYQRRLGIVEEGSPPGGYRDDVTRVAASLGPEERVLYASIPFVELFADHADTAFALMQNRRSSTRFTPAAGITVTRPLQTRLRDLVLPYRATFETAREFRVDNDSTSSSGRLTIEGRTLAANLFGSLGAYPRTQLFRTDEYETRIRVRIDYADTIREVTQQQYLTELSMRVFPRPATEASLTHTSVLEYGTTTGTDHRTRLQGSFEHDPERAQALPVPVPYAEAALRSEHDVSVQLQRRHTPDPGDLVRISGGSRVVALYDTTLRLVAGARIGYDVTGLRTEGASVIERLGFELSVTGRYRF